MNRTCFFRIFVALLALTLFPPTRAGAATADDFRTPEYLTNRYAYDWIRAAEAYSQGYSGKGVTVGVLDSIAFPLHNEFFQKAPYPVKWFTTPKPGDWHGVHTAGTIAASRDGLGMHGVAWDANLVSMVGIDGDIPRYERGEKIAEAISAFSKYPEVSIISNSWAYHLALADWPGMYSYAFDDTKMAAAAMAKLMTESGTLFVFAAANDGQASPSVPAALPALMTGASMIGNTISPATEFSELTEPEKRALSLNMISVSAFDPGRATNRLDFIAPFSNLTDGAAHFSLLAPGVDIYSAVGPGADDYSLMSGTSMATPHVSGVAALVKEAFPWMNGKQLADTLLSTAVHLNSLDGLPPFLIQTGSHPLSGNPVFSVTAPGAVTSAGLTGHEEEIRRLWHSSQREKYGETLEDFTARLVGAMDSAIYNDNPNVLIQDGPPYAWIPLHIIKPEQYMALFGMGVVNAGQAVRGPGWIDANRLSNGDRAGYSGSDYAMYGVDTGGYDGVWFHDIGQIKVGDAAYPNGVTVPAPNAFNSALANLPVGLRKQGGGTLTLTGANTYLGPTVIAGGEIALGLPGQANQAAQLAGDVYVESAGKFSGNGLVQGSLYAYGRLAPGFAAIGGSQLRVVGNMESRGLMQFSIRETRIPALSIGGAADIAGTAVSLAGMDARSPLPSGVYPLINAQSVTGATRNASAQTLQGVSLAHTFNMCQTGTALNASYDHSEAAPQAKNLSEGALATLTMVNQGADIVAGQGMTELRGAARRASAESGYGIATFGALSAGYSRYNTGSHVDVSGLSLLTGFGWGRDIGGGHLALGAFFEFGAGSYDAYNSFSNSASVHGNGRVTHTGGGVLGRYDSPKFSQSQEFLSRFYAEASARAGGVHNQYQSSDLRDYQGRSAEYEYSSQYYSLHGGLGLILNPTEAFSMDIYGKYFWTRQEGDSVRLSTGEPLKFDAADSHRLRLGSRFAYAVNEYVSPYIGAAWEHEFDGRQKASTYGYSIKAPSLRGDTGISDLGLTLKPSQSLPLSFDLGVQGYVGKREGVTGMLQAKWEF